MRLRHPLARIAILLGASAGWLALAAGAATAQIVEITPSPTAQPSAKLEPGTQWVYWMALGAAALVVLAILLLSLNYLRFAPKFFGREEAPRPAPPGARPPELARRAAAIRYRPPAQVQPAPASVGAATGAGGASGGLAPSRPAPASAPAPAPAAVPAPAAPEAPVEVSAAQAPAEVPVSGAPARPEAAPAPEPAPAPPAQAPAAPPAEAGHGPALDQETFDRVLREQLDRGVDRRVAEGRARAAAVVAARRKAGA